MTRRRAFTLTFLLAAELAAARANAGLTYRDFDLVHVHPYIGAEYARIGFGEVVQGRNGVRFTGGEVSITGPAVGTVIGVRLAPISIGLLLQRSSGSDGAGRDLDMSKIYGELGVNARYGRAIVLAHIDFGYAYLRMRDMDNRGIGGKVGLALDFYPIPMLSFGAGAAFDGQGYSVGNGVIGGVGGTFNVRFGFHL